MINVNEIINKAVESNASDIHFISGLKPTLRINRDLIPIEDEKIISDDDMWDIYDFFLSGNVDRDKLFREKKVLDCSAEIGDVRLRVNVSYSNAVPVITTRKRNTK